MLIRGTARTSIAVGDDGRALAGRIYTLVQAFAAQMVVESISL
jgi:hypothetical protein